MQEYFIPIDDFDDFVEEMGEIYRRYNANIINISVRHAFADLESNLSWARQECFAFVVYYKQKTDEASKTETWIWHRELMNLVSKYNWAYYLPYQPHASFETFKKAYPKFKFQFLKLHLFFVYNKLQKQNILALPNLNLILN